MEFRTAKKFYDNLAKGKIYGIRCRKCKKYTFPPLLRCRECSSESVEWVVMKGTGKLHYYSSTMLPAIKFVGEPPSAYGLVEMSEGPVFLTKINNADISSPDSIAKGNKALPLPVKARVRKIAGMDIVTFDIKK